MNKRSLIERAFILNLVLLLAMTLGPAGLLTVQANGCTEADLVVHEMKVRTEAGVFLNPGDTVPEGTRIKVFVTIKNVGNVTSDDFWMRVYDNDDPFATTAVHIIAPGETRERFTDYHTMQGAGRHVLRVDLDINDEVEECDETNNSATFVIYVEGEGGTYEARWVSQAYEGDENGPFVPVPIAGQSEELWVRFENTGTAVWTTDNVRLKPQARDNPGDPPDLRFSCNGGDAVVSLCNVISDDNGDGLVDPGESGEFCIQLCGNAQPVGPYVHAIDLGLWIQSAGEFMDDPTNGNPWGKANVWWNVEVQESTSSTLILVNREKVSELFGDSVATELMSKLDSLAAHPRVNGLVIQVEHDPDVAAAYAARGDNYGDRDRANAVAEAIRQVILAQWDADPEVEYLVLVGDDRVMPFYRTVDGTSTPDPWTLTDDFYLDHEPTPCSDCANPNVYIPDLAGGRLLEAPDQIIGQLDTFLAGSELNLSSAAVTGYEFMIDCGAVHCNTLQADNLTTDCTLIGESWTSNDFISRVLHTYHDATSINGHASSYGFGTPSGVVNVSDFTNSPLDFARAIFYTTGCHAGENVLGSLDLPEGLAIKRANYIANTGYGWGSRVSVGLSEELMWNFTRQLVVGTHSSPGRALKLAKQQYFADHPAPGVYDEKITTESTLYGLPMYGVISPAVFLSAADIGIRVSVVQTPLGNGLHKDSASYSWSMPTPVSSPEGTYYTIYGTVIGRDGEPILPRFSHDVSKSGLALHGVVFTGGSYTTVSQDPPLQRFVTTAVQARPVAQSFSAPGWYPEIFFTHNVLKLKAMDRAMLVAAAGQYNPNLTTNQQRVYTGMSFDIYYHQSSSDWTPPRIWTIDKNVTGSTVKVTVNASDASGLEAVVVAYTGGDGTWNSQALTLVAGLWTGSFPGSADTEILVQAVDKAGNVNVGNEENGDLHLPIILNGFG